MKISKLFHWLYFIVMMLPIFTIPIFAIYSHRHAIDSFSVQAEETKVVNFNQLVNNGNFVHGTDYWRTNNANLFVNNDVAYTTATAYRGSLVQSVKELPTADNQVVLVKVYLKTTANAGDIDIYFYGGYGFKSNIQSNSYQWIEKIVTTSISWGNDLYNQNLVSIEDRRSENFDSVEVKYVMAFNLTQMFGTGNEPTIEQFNSWYAADYYEYSTGHNELLYTGNVITYADTDIGSQFTYDVYNVVDKYFNYDSVFNFSQLYDWLNITFFNGGASLGFFIFWHLLIYWLLTSILWLIFDVLMYVPQLVHRWLDKASIS